jgi:hypothetical protein
MKVGDILRKREERELYERVVRAAKTKPSKKGKIIIGKHIPFHWGEAEFLNLEFHNIGDGSLTGHGSFPNIESALLEYPRAFQDALRTIKSQRDTGKEWMKRMDTFTESDAKWGVEWAVRNVPMICPEFRAEHAIMNPYFTQWNSCLLPLLPVKTEEDCRKLGGELTAGTCVILFDEEQQQTWRDNHKDLRMLLLKDDITEEEAAFGEQHATRT